MALTSGAVIGGEKKNDELFDDGGLADEMMDRIRIDLEGCEDPETRKIKSAVADVMAIMLNINLKPINQKLERALFKTDILEDDVRVLGENIDTVKDCVKNVESVNEKLVLDSIEQGVYMRKKNLILSGVPGVEKEDNGTTIQKVQNLFRGALNFELSEYKFSVIHRLSQRADSAIIISLVRLTDTNTIMEKAKLLAPYNIKNKVKVSLQVQTHPAIREIRDNLLKWRKEMPVSDIKYHVKSLAEFPFFGLCAKNKKTIFDDKTKSDVVKMYLQYIDNKKGHK